MLALSEYTPFRMNVHEFSKMTGLGLIAVCDDCTAHRRSSGRDRTVWHAVEQLQVEPGVIVKIDMVEDIIHGVLEATLH